MSRAIVCRVLAFAALWAVLSEGRSAAAWLGAVTVAAATGASLLLVPPSEKRLRWTALPAFFVFFLAGSLRGGWLTAKLALRSRRSVSPTMLELPLPFRQEAPRATLVGVMGLMPGALSVDVCGDRLRVHVLDERLPAAQEAQALIAHVTALFGEEE